MFFKRSVRCLVPVLTLISLLGVPITARAQTTTRVNFTGMTLSQTGPLNGFNYAPPDTMGAVGNNEFVEFINGGFQIFSKASGAGISSTLTPGGRPITDTAFWTAAGLSNVGSLSDPRILFDRASQRWVATELTTGQSTGNSVLIARSETSDPTAGWKATSFVPTSTGFADYDTLSLNADGIYIGTNNFTSSTGSFANESLSVIPKADIYATTPSLSRLSVITSTTLGTTLQGAVDYGPSTGRNAIYGSFNSTNLRRFNVANLTSPPASAANQVLITTATDASPTSDALQPDGTAQLDSGDNRISGNVLKVGDRVYMARTVSVGGRAGIRITILSESTNAVLAETTISAANRDYLYPSIAANGNGDLIVGFSRTGSAPGEFPSAYARGGAFNGTTITLDSADTLLQSGSANYHLFGGANERWGDYSATMTDPNDPNSFWTIQEFAAGSNNWATQVTNIRLGAFSLPEPSALPFLLFGVPGVVLVRRQK